MKWISKQEIIIQNQWIILYSFYSLFYNSCKSFISPSLSFFYDFIYESIYNTITYSNHIVYHKRDPYISHSPIPFSFCVFLFVLFFLVCNSYIWIQKKSFSLLFRNLLFLLIISSHLILVLLYLLHIINRNGYSSTRPFYSIE